MKYETLALNVLVFPLEVFDFNHQGISSESLKVHNNQIYEDGMVFRFDSYDKTFSITTKSLSDS